MGRDVEGQSRGPLALAIAGVVMTVLGWGVFTIGIFVVVAQAEDGSTTSTGVGTVVVVLAAIVGSLGTVALTGAALWWAFGNGTRNQGPKLSGSRASIRT